jgi:hypothetical protein
MPSTIRGDDFYLGDGYYAAFDGHSVRIYTSRDLVTVENAVYLSPVVTAIFLDWLHRKCPEQFKHIARVALTEAAAQKENGNG